MGQLTSRLCDGNREEAKGAGDDGVTHVDDWSWVSEATVMLESDRVAVMVDVDDGRRFVVGRRERKGCYVMCEIKVAGRWKRWLACVFVCATLLHFTRRRRPRFRRTAHLRRTASHKGPTASTRSRRHLSAVRCPGPVCVKDGVARAILEAARRP